MGPSGLRISLLVRVIIQREKFEKYFYVDDVACACTSLDNVASDNLLYDDMLYKREEKNIILIIKILYITFILRSDDVAYGDVARSDVARYDTLHNDMSHTIWQEGESPKVGLNKNHLRIVLG